MRKLLGQFKDMFSCGGSKASILHDKHNQIDLARPIETEQRIQFKSEVNMNANNELISNGKDGGRHERRVSKGHSTTQLLSNFSTSETLCVKVEKAESEVN